MRKHTTCLLINLMKSRRKKKKAAQKYPYSMDWNMWHLSHEGDDLENPANPPHKDMYLVTCDPEDAPDQPEFVTIEFKEGKPIAANGRKWTVWNWSIR